MRGDNHLAVKNKLHEYFHVKFSLWEDIQYWLSYGGTYQSVLPVFADATKKPININRFIVILILLITIKLYPF